MTDEEFRAAIVEFKSSHAEEGSLVHAAKGSTWKNHKYIRIENGRYIYDDKNASGPTGATAEQKAAENASRHAGRLATEHSKAVDTQVEELDKVHAREIVGIKGDSAGPWSDSNHENISKAQDELKKYGYDDDQQWESYKEAVEKSIPGKNITKSGFTKEAEELAKQIKEGTELKKARDEGRKATEEYKKEEAKNTLKELGSAVKKLGDKIEGQRLLNNIQKASDQAYVNMCKSYGLEGKEITDAMQRGEIAFKEGKEEARRAAEQSAKELQKKYGEEARIDDSVPGMFTIRVGNGLSSVKDWVKYDNLYECVQKNAALVKKEKESKKVQHSFDDPKDFYAAVYDYKKAHKR